MDLKLKLRPSFFFSFLIFIFLLKKPVLGSASNPKCISTERQALLTFKQSLTDPSGRLSSWSGPDCCEWRGVLCDRRTSRVIKIDLRTPNQTVDFDEFKQICLGGKIHPSLTRLKFLSYLDLSSNDFNGLEIPEFIGLIVSLRYLNLSLSSFSGEVPATLGNLSKLESLDLYTRSFNENGWPSFDLRASSLGWLSGLSSSLTYLNMGYVSLSGAGENWLQDFSRLSKLKELHLFECGLKKLPLSLPFPSANLKLLEVLDLSRNFFVSSIPEWLFDLTSLRKLFLPYNDLEGSIPSGFKNLRLLETLDLSNNQLRGEVPAVLGDLPQLKYLDLSRNNFFQGRIRMFLDALSRNNNNGLVYLNLHFNMLNGTLPESLGALRNLQILDLSYNSFTGSIPSSVGNMTSLKKLDLSYNSMNGKIAESFGKLEELVDLYLEGNNWEGVLVKSHFVNLRSLKTIRLTTQPDRSLVFKVPSTWVPPFRLELISIENCQIGPSFPMWLQVQNKLNYVTLKNTGIMDKIPHSWFSGIAPVVTQLYLDNNRFKGTLPQNLVFPKLNVIDLNSNNFEGAFPRWTTNATQLRLYQNNFSGSLPTDINVLMPRVRTMFLFQNSFTGEIPSSLCEATKLEFLSLRNNRFSGSFPKCWHGSSKLYEIDVSENNISGEIPESLWDIPNLSMLFLNQNAFEGNIPNHFSSDYGITQIDLSGNSINGEIPSEILDLPYLQILNLSRNSIEGSIPGKVSKDGRLETLDLSRNRISGAIPQSLAVISSLHTLNLSFNKLEGSIPKQLKFKDPSIYIGNELLCGKPLPKKCPKKQQIVVVN